MQGILTWLGLNWWWIAIAATVLISILNAATKHWSNHAGARKVLLFIVEVLSVLVSAGAVNGRAGKLKLPLTSVRPDAQNNPHGIAAVDALYGTIVACLFAGALLFLASGCATTQPGQQKFDPCTALTATMGGHQVLDGGSTVVCSLLPEPKRSQCFKYQQVISGGAQALVNLAATVLKTCTVQR